MMKSDTHLLNRLNEGGLDPSGWMHVCPFGEFPWTSPDGKESIIQVIDAQAVRAMAASYPLDVRNSMVDKEHLSMTADGDTAALGWGKAAKQEQTGLWVKVEWTPEGRQAVENKVYKFNSPCFSRDGLQHLGGNRYRVTKLGRIALTNNPNLSGQEPLTNRRAEAANPNAKHTTSTMDYKTILLSLLGLPADTSDDQITAAVSGKKGSETAMNNRITDLETQLANRDLDAHGITDAEQRKFWSPLLCNKDQRPAALTALGVMKSKAAPVVQPPIHNRGAASVPTVTQDLSKGADKDADAEARKFNAEVLDYKNTKGCSYEAAHQYISNRRQAEGN
jgi:phage I-like protein